MWYFVFVVFSEVDQFAETLRPITVGVKWFAAYVHVSTSAWKNIGLLVMEELSIRVPCTLGYQYVFTARYWDCMSSVCPSVCL